MTAFQRIILSTGLCLLLASSLYVPWRSPNADGYPSRSHAYSWIFKPPEMYLPTEGSGKEIDLIRLGIEWIALLIFFSGFFFVASPRKQK